MADQKRGTEQIPDDGEIESALASVERTIAGTIPHLYFLTHRNRYKSYVKTVAASYDRGDILEIGCSPCQLTAVLKLLGYPVTGLDLAPERDRIVIEQFGLSIKRCDIERERWPFPDDAFRYVVFADVFEHLRVDPLFALSEANRVSAHRGLMFLATPNLYAIQQIARFVTGRGLGDPVVEFMKLRARGHMGHIREYSHAEIRRFLTANHYRVERVAYEHYYYPRTWRGLAARILFRMLPARFRSEQTVLARKIAPGPGLSPLV